MNVRPFIQKTIPTLCGLGLAACVASRVQAGSINMSIEWPDNVTPPATLVGPAGGLGETWNQFSTTSAILLKDTNGVSTSVGYFSSGTGWGGPDLWSYTALGLIRSGLRNFDVSSANSQRFEINGLTAGQMYSVWIASANCNSGQRSKGVWSTPNQTTTVGDQPCNNTTDLNEVSWVEGNNYVLFENVKADVNGKITFNGHSLDGYRLPLNGFQLMEIIEESPPVTSTTIIVR
ncbi:MAG: hypothetical protein O2854_10185 [Chloroflexi bacterium]|nr:hypothetical protein [Chloroflexota bacterium]